MEIFYDLFFAANYNVFSQNQSVTNHQRFKAYIGYFSLLWGTWFVVTLFDVRFVTDSIFGTFCNPSHNSAGSSANSRPRANGTSYPAWRPCWLCRRRTQL